MLSLPSRYPALLALAEDLRIEVPPVEVAADLETARDWLAVRNALAQDVTTRAVVAANAQVQARIEARAEGVIAGLEVAADVFRLLAADARVSPAVGDGAAVSPGDLILQVQGPAAAVLVAERTALNLLQHLSGVATATRRLVDAVGSAEVAVLDTRKTTPGLRSLERAAVRAGGGVSHREGLYDQVLLKENHFALSGLGYRDAVAKAVAAQAANDRSADSRPVIAEARDAAEALAAVEGGAGVVLLDNFRPDPELAGLVAELRAAAERAGRPVQFEVSGGITPETAGAYAACGIDRLSVGMVTHSAPALDMSLLMAPALEVQGG